MFAALGRFSYRRRWWVLAVWAAAFVAALSASTRLSHDFKSSAYVDPEAPSQQALYLMQDRVHNGMSRVTIVFTSDTLEARSPEFQAAETEALAGYTKEAFPDLNSVHTYSSTVDDRFVSKDGHSSLAWVVFDVPVDQLEQQVPDVKAALRPSGLQTHVTGEATVIRDLETVSADDIRSAESVLFPVALLLLLLVFGTVVAAGLPIIGGGAAVAVTLGALALLAPHRDLSAFSVSIAALLGLGEGIVYSLLTVSRFREELRHGRVVPDAVEETMARAGWAILVSGSTVVVCLLGLVSFAYTSLNSIGVGGALVVTFSVLAALTLQPALLSILGARVNSWRILWRPDREGHRLERWSRLVGRHPRWALIGGLLVVLVVAWPLVAIKVDVPDARSLPAGTESRIGDEMVKTQFDPAVLDPVELLVTWSDRRDPFTPKDLATEYEFGMSLYKVPGVAGVTSIVNIPVPGGLPTFQKFWPVVLTGEPPEHPVKGGLPVATVMALLTPLERKAALVLVRGTTAPGTVLYEVKPAAPPTSREAQQLAARLREVEPPPGASVHVTGTAEGVRGYLDALNSRTPWVVAFVAVAAFVLLSVFMRSVALGLLSVVASGLSLLASFGVLVWIFQMGHLEGLLGFESVGTVDGNTAVVLFCIVFGVSMDYQVFLLARVREAWTSRGGEEKGEGGGDGRQAVAAALTSTGRIILSSGLVMVVAASSFAFTGVIITKAIGVGLAVAIVIDALIVRMLIVPAALCLLDRRAWWPGGVPQREGRASVSAATASDGVPA
jgi:RND superfamily putative drug exporter